VNQNEQSRRLHGRLIEPSTQNPSDSSPLIRRIISKPKVQLGALLLVTSLGIISSVTPPSLAYEETHDHDSFVPKSSQNMNILASTFSTEVPKAIGGPDAPIIEDGTLHPYIGMSSSATATVRQDKDGLSYYTVQEGDTLSEIADLFMVTENTILWENNISKTITVGQELRILPVSGIRHKVQKGDTISSIASLYQVESEDVSVFNGLRDGTLVVGNTIVIPNGVKPAEKAEEKKEEKKSSGSKKNSSGKSGSGSGVSSGYYTRPTSGPVTSNFGPRNGSYHYGIDYGVSIGTSVYAAASGKVVKTSCGSGYGICLVIQHDNGTQTLYAHLSEMKVTNGKRVSKGDHIAESGNSGRSSGPHLHFEIISSNGQKLNPAKYVK
jgi:LysM repeat protein